MIAGAIQVGCCTLSRARTADGVVHLEFTDLIREHLRLTTFVVPLVTQYRLPYHLFA
jgi:hypothetical protein